MKLAATVLSLRLMLAKRGGMPAAAFVLFLLGLAAWLVLAPRARRELTDYQQLVMARQKAASEPRPKAALSPAAEAQLRLEKFHARLGERHYPEQQIKTLFALARQANLPLQKGEYRFADEPVAGLATYKISLPVQGSFAAIRRFSEQALVRIPFAALDEISFQREHIGSERIDAIVHFTLYLSDQAAPAPERSLPSLPEARP